jgi:hypothetical protein
MTRTWNLLPTSLFVNLKTRFLLGHFSRSLFTFWPGGFCGSYFYRSYYLISVKTHRVKNIKRYRVCFFNSSTWCATNHNLMHVFIPLIWKCSTLGIYILKLMYWLLWYLSGIKYDSGIYILKLMYWLLWYLSGIK